MARVSIDGEKLRRLRAEKGWTQADLARAADVSRTTIARMEYGDSPVSSRTVALIASELGVTFNDLATYGEPETTTTQSQPPQQSLTVTVTPYFHKRPIEVEDDLVFVLMPFTESWSDYVWNDEIKKTIVELPSHSLRCLRADDLYGNDVMIDVYESIASARIVVADITGRNANVFYELGIAHTLGKDVILLSQGTEHIPFDLLRFRHCIYSDDGPGYKVLRAYLENAVGGILNGNTDGK
jgi:transcriptional regulator with XRE-family HTH domain